MKLDGLTGPLALVAFVVIVYAAFHYGKTGKFFG